MTRWRSLCLEYSDREIRRRRSALMRLVLRANLARLRAVRLRRKAVP